MRRLLFLLVFALCGCQTLAARTHTARDIASSVGLQERDISAAPFLLRAYERVNDPASGTIRIYIEGDGLAWLDRTSPSPDPTPVHPTGLLLAQADDSANVAYIARPCQFSRQLLSGDACPVQYWTNGRFAPEIVSAMNAAITDVARRYNAGRIELVGYSGGAALAVLVAARRADVADIRTVAGNLDTDLFSELHHVSPLTGSLNPKDVSVRLAALPQLHFTGADDQIVPIALFESYRRSSGSSPCVGSVVVRDMTHDGPWAAQWQKLLHYPFACATK